MKRNLASYFSGLLGYLFIVVFVVLGALCAFQNEFFRGNQCTLDQLSEWFPWLLLFIVPAITMNIWSEERRRGTDELLFTLPSTDVQILLGKYLAVVVVYSVAILFSLTHVIVLAWLGDPDPYRLVASYIGYWCAGCALLATGMVASSLTNSAAVAFVLGAVFCAVPVGLSLIPGLEEFLQPLTVGYHLNEFARGTIPLQSLFYFAALAGLMLYINNALNARRRWMKAGGMHLRWHYLIRGISLAAILLSLGFVVRAVANWSIDMTAEGLYTLAGVTHETIEQINESKPVTIEVYLSKDIGAPYNRVKTELEGVLSRLHSAAGRRLDIQWNYLDAFTQDEADAEENGMEPLTYLRDDESTTHATEEVAYMGLVVRRGDERVVIPSIDLGTSIEYEITRAVGTVIQTERLTIGILRTPAAINERRVNPETQEEGPPWRIVQELEKQYEVVDVDPASLVTFDVFTSNLGWTADGLPATADTLLNDLDAIDTPFEDQDAVVISGSERRPVVSANDDDGDSDDADGSEEDAPAFAVIEIEEELAVGPQSTLGDLLTKLDEVFESSNVVLDVSGRIVLTAVEPGPQNIRVELSNKPENTGRLRFDAHELSNPQDFDVLLAVLPSLLTHEEVNPRTGQLVSEEQMGPFVDYVRAGYPTLIFDDPWTGFDSDLSISRMTIDPFSGRIQMPPTYTPAGRLTSLMSVLQCAWEGDVAANEDFILLDDFNPHPHLEFLQPTYAFVARQSGSPQAINPRHPITADLQEVLAWYPGTIRPHKGTDYEFTPLLRSSSRFSGLIDLEQLFDASLFGPDYEAGSTRRVLANRSGWTINGEAATGDTPLNDLDDLATPFEEGDVIEISGSEQRLVEGEDDEEDLLTTHTINHEFAVDDATTLDDLVAKLNELYESAEATLSSNGRVVLTANESGESTLQLTLLNGDGNQGELLFDFNPIEIQNEGSQAESHVLAAAITSTNKSAGRMNVIFMADSDVLSDTILRVEFDEQADLKLDNSRFVMNAIDYLAGHVDFIDLRSRRSGLRTLTAIERVQQQAHEEFLRLSKQVQLDAEQNTADAQARFDRRIRQIEAETSLSAIALVQELEYARADRDRRLGKLLSNSLNATAREMRRLRNEEQRDVRRAEKRAWALAVCIPPLPAALLGLGVLVWRLSRERSYISSDRRLRRAA